MSLSSESRELVESRLVGAAFADRLAHSYAVAEKTRLLSSGIGERSSEWYWCLGLLHDIGYSEPLSGHHGLDGARIVSAAGPDLAQFAAHIAWHSTAKWEYEILGLSSGDPMPGLVDHSLLWMADFTTGPQGQPITLEGRIAEIRSRHSPSSSAVLAIEESMPSLVRAEEIVRPM